ncbi:DUF4309 domain-containing protein [Cytobacillus suaedae]|nr:DUF4309 domain-containing protein [Cytobacillus suaedae]
MKYFILLFILTMVLSGCSQDEQSEVTKEIKETEESKETAPQNEEKAETPTHEFFNEDFKNLLNEGKLANAEFGIGSTAAEIKEALGEPDLEDIWDGANILQYGNVVYGYSYLEEDDTIYIIEYAPEKDYYLADLTTLLGEPEVSEISDVNGRYFVLYHLEDLKELWVYNVNEKEDSPISHIKLIKKY